MKFCYFALPCGAPVRDIIVIEPSHLCSIWSTNFVLCMDDLLVLTSPRDDHRIVCSKDIPKMTKKIECGTRICCHTRRNESNAKFAGWRARVFRKMPLNILGIQFEMEKKKHNFQNWQFARFFSFISSFSLLHTWRRKRRENI